MLYIGLDVHQRKTTVAWLDDETGELSVERSSVPTEALPEHLSALPDPKRIVLEAGSSAVFVARQLMACGWEVVVVHPGKSRPVIATYGRAKTDRADARGLVQAFAAGELDRAAIWVPGPWISDLRELTRARQRLVEQSTETRTAIRQALVRWGLPCPFRDLMGQNAQAWLEELSARLTLAQAQVLDAYRDTLTHLTDKIEALTAAIETMVRDHPDVQRLTSVIGIAVLSAAVIVAEIGDIHRFACAARLRSYSGLVPTVKQSGNRRFTGPLTKAGNRYLRRTMVLVAQHFACSRQTQNLRLRRWYARLVYRHGPNPAKVALARRLLDIIFAMLRDSSTFDAERYALAA